MSEIRVGPASSIEEGDRRIVMHGDIEIGVFRWQGKFYAYENLCVHQGGPACEGLIMHKVEDVLATDRTFVRQTFSETDVHFVCPWHGYEYDLKTGECVGDRRLKLRRYKVVERGGEIFVVAV
jgi:nitrite reductase/ring-hydroxylating ferredoxin subunit